MAEPVNLTLTRSIKAHGKDVTALTFRPLTAKDIRQAGLPYTYTPDGGRRIDMQAITQMIMNCAVIPTSSIDQMAPGDFTAAMDIVVAFFMDGTRERPSP